jgi:hypothetical protein
MSPGARPSILRAAFQRAPIPRGVSLVRLAQVIGAGELPRHSLLERRHQASYLPLLCADVGEVPCPYERLGLGLGRSGGFQLGFGCVDVCVREPAPQRVALPVDRPLVGLGLRAATFLAFGLSPLRGEQILGCRDGCHNSGQQRSSCALSF